MITKEEFYYDSRDRETKIHAVKWIPENKPKAILQISHGMVEFIDRYDEFARFLAERDIMVVGNDHLGHGDSVKSKADFGYFCKNDPDTVVVRDVHRLKKLTQEQNPGIPYFILGHSMGSFILRKYIAVYGSGIDGALIVGTGNQSMMLVNAGIFIVKFLKAFKGERYRGELVKKISFKGYNSHFEPKRTENDWLTRDEKIVDFYNGDERCQFTFTLNAYGGMFNIIKYVNNEGNLKKIPVKLPVIFLAGKEDPVGDYGKGVTAVYERFKALGLEDLSIKLYDNDRHEILNELDRDNIYNDIYNWLDSKLNSEAVMDKYSQTI